MSITTTIEQTAGGTGSSPVYTESRVIRRAGRRAQFAFCVYIILYYVLLQVTPSANRNSYRVAIPYYIYTQGRGDAHLNPGLCNRNSYRVAGAVYHPRWANIIIPLGAHHPPWTNHLIPTVTYHHQWPNNQTSLDASHPQWANTSTVQIYIDHTHRNMVRTPGNSVGVAFSQPRVADEVRYPG